MGEESRLGSGTMTFLARKSILPIVTVVVTPTVITREPVVPSLHTGTAARTVPYDPGFPSSPFYLYETKEGVSAICGTRERDYERVWRKLNHTRYITYAGLKNHFVR